MSDELHVMALLEEGNPATEVSETSWWDTNAATYLEALADRSSEMTTSSKTEKPINQRILRWAIVAVVLLVFGTIVYLNRQSADETSLVAQSTPEQPEIAAILEFIATYNAGDAAGLRAAIDPAFAVGWSLDGQIRNADEIFMNANRHLTVVEPCTISATSASTVECTVAEVNDFHGAAGLTFEAVSRFALNDELQVTDWTDNWACCLQQIAFHQAFWDWLEAKYPAVYSGIAPKTSDGLPGLNSDPAEMTIAVQYVEEFVAESDAYPIEPDGS